MRRICSGSCARATRGHVAALPISAINCRRLTSVPPQAEDRTLAYRRMRALLCYAGDDRGQLFHFSRARHSYFVPIAFQWLSSRVGNRAGLSRRILCLTAISSRLRNTRNRLRCADGLLAFSPIIASIWCCCQRGDAFVAMHTAECFEDIAVGLLRDRLVLGEAVMLVIGDNGSDRVHECPLSGVKWTSKFKSVTSAFDPKRT